MEYPKYENFNASNCTERSIRLHYPEFYSYLIETYTQCEKFTEKLYWFYNNIKDFPKCECGNDLKFKNLKVGYSSFCCKKCSDSSQKTKDKRKNTLIERYGIENMMQSQEFKDKIKKTVMEKYGVENVFQAQEIKEKIKETNLKNIGVEYPMQSKEVLEKSSNTIKEKYGVEWNCQRKEYTFLSESKPNKEFADLLDSFNIEYEREFAINRYRYDFKVGNTLIEIDPSGTHNSTWGVYGKEAKDINYHKNKSLFAEANGYRCIHVWDWDDKEKIIDILKEKENIDSSDCVILEVSKEETDRFLNMYHLQNTCEGQDIRIGLYYNKDLIQIITFNKLNGEEYELLRLCSKRDVVVNGGPEKLFKYFIEIYKPSSIISYCDRSKFDGNIYNILKFKKEKESRPSKHWYKRGRHITDNLLKQRGFDQIFKTNYGKGTSNRELMLESGFVEIYDCGQDAYIWKS